MVQLAWRWLLFQKGSVLSQWYRARTADARKDIRKTMIVALVGAGGTGRVAADRCDHGAALWKLDATGEHVGGARQPGRRRDDALDSGEHPALRLVEVVGEAHALSEAAAEHEQTYSLIMAAKPVLPDFFGAE